MPCPALQHGPVALAPRPLVLLPLSPVTYPRASSVCTLHRAPGSSHGPSRAAQCAPGSAVCTVHSPAGSSQGPTRAARYASGSSHGSTRAVQCALGSSLCTFHRAPGSSHGPPRGPKRPLTLLAPRSAQRDVETDSATGGPGARTEGSSVALGQVKELDSALEAFTAARSAQQSREQLSARSQGGRGGVPEPLAELEAGRKALDLARGLAANGVLRGFGGGSQVPRRAYSIDELRLHRIDTTRLLSPKDTTLGKVRRNAQLGLLAGLGAAWLLLDQLSTLFWLLLLLTLGTADQIGTGGAIESTIVDTVGHVLSRKYRERVCLHEAGHFLTAYLLGILPASYSISSFDSLQRLGVLSAQQAGTTFVDVEFQEQVQSGKLSSEILEGVVCIGLAGVCAEYVVYEVSEGGVTDIQQLDSLFRSLRFTQTKSDEVVRWAVLNTVILLRAHRELLSKLATCLEERKSVGQCIAVIEENLCLN